MTLKLFATSAFLALITPLACIGLAFLVMVH